MHAQGDSERHSPRRRALVPRLAGDSLWYATAGLLSKLLAVITVPVLTRTLGPADYGLMDLATALAGFLVLAATFAGDIPAARLTVERTSSGTRRDVYGGYVAAVAVVSLVITSVLLPLTEAIATVIWAVPEAADLVALGVLLVPITAVRLALATLQRLEGRPRAYALLATIELVAQLTLAVGLAVTGFGARGVLLGLILGSVIGGVAAAVGARGMFTLRVHPAWLLRLFTLGLPFLPAIVAFTASDYIARAIVSAALGPESVGGLGVAIRLASVVMLVSAAFQLAWGPRAIRMDVDAATRQTFSRILLSYTMVTALVCVTLAALGPEMIIILSGSGFVAGATALPGLLAAALIAGSHFILAMAAGVLDRGWSVGLSSLVGAATQVLITLFAVEALGLFAVGLGALVGRATSVGILGIRARSLFDRRFWAATSMSVATAGVCIVIGVLNATPDETLLLRMGLAGLASLAGVVIVLRFLDDRRKDPGRAMV